MRRIVLLAMFATTTAAAQDSSFSALQLRASALRLPVIGRLDDDWRASTGVELGIASNVGRSEIGLTVGRVGFEPTTGRPPFTETLISLGWTLPILQRRWFGMSVGGRLTDVRFDFDDPSMVAGLRNEEEQLISAITRARIRIGRGYSGFVDAAYGVLMTSTRSPTMTLAVGFQHDGAMPGWLREFLR
jgi:hypothetical protein